MATEDPYGQDVLAAALGDAPNAQTLAQNAVLGLVPHVMLWYASAAERDATLIGAYAPVEGMICWLRDVNQALVYNGTAWVPPPTVLTTVTSGLTASTGYSVIDFSGYRRADVITVYCNLSRTGADIVANSAGNVTDSPLCTLPANWRPPTTLTAGVGDGFGAGECQIEATGLITIRAWSPTGVITGGGRQIRVAQTFVAGP
jgi:hypothetical protein